MDIIVLKNKQQESTFSGISPIIFTSLLPETFPGTGLLLINSVCGCAAGSARPGLKMALEYGKKPGRVATVFAGQDLEATGRARELIGDVPPSSPSLALIKDGELVHFVPRHLIEGQSADVVARELSLAFDEHC